MKLSIEIDSDNEGCQSIDDLAEIMIENHSRIFGTKVINNLRHFGQDDGNIIDVNGNTIGKWRASK